MFSCWEGGKLGVVKSLLLGWAGMVAVEGGSPGGSVDVRLEADWDVMVTKNGWFRVDESTVMILGRIFVVSASCKEVLSSGGR